MDSCRRILLFLVFGLVIGAIVATRRPDNRVGSHYVEVTVIGATGKLLK